MSKLFKRQCYRKLAVVADNDNNKLVPLATENYRLLKWNLKSRKILKHTISEETDDTQITPLPYRPNSVHSKLITKSFNQEKLENKYRSTPIQMNFVTDEKEYSFRCNKEVDIVNKRLLSILKTNQIKVCDAEFIKFASERFDHYENELYEKKIRQLALDEIYRVCSHFSVQQRMSKLLKESKLPQCDHIEAKVEKKKSPIKSTKIPLELKYIYQSIVNKPRHVHYRNDSKSSLAINTPINGEIKHFWNKADDFIKWKLHEFQHNFVRVNPKEKKSNEVNDIGEISKSDKLEWNTFQLFTKFSTD